MTTPTLINLPPPPSDPVTPSDMGPGTPNSGTTSLSALSTTAIKDGHQGHPMWHGHHHNQSTGSATSTNTLDAERADRISRLAGLERVSTVRQNAPASHLQPGSVNSAQQPPGYFDNSAQQIRERSTVGSASATGSVGGRTTWASGSDTYDPDKMSEDQDDGHSSNGGFSDEGNASLVGFGEGAGSTVSGPVSTVAARASAARQNSVSSITKANAIPQHAQYPAGSPMSGVISSPTPPGSSDPRMMDGISYDQNVVDTTAQGPVHTSGQHGRDLDSTGTDVAERIMRERLGADQGGRVMESPDGRGQNLGKFGFEEN